MRPTSHVPPISVCFALGLSTAYTHISRLVASDKVFLGAAGGAWGACLCLLRVVETEGTPFIDPDREPDAG